MKYFLLALLFASSLGLRAETLQAITTALPLGIEKDKILKKEPSAKVIPCMVSPIDVTARCECIVLMKATDDGRIVGQFYLVNDKLAAMLLSKVAMPGTTENTQDETAFISDYRKLSGFSALRIDPQLNPVEIPVQKYALDQINQVALLMSTARGRELFIIDESVFDPRSFFMEPTADNKEKLLRNKQSIEAQRRSYEEIK